MKTKILADSTSDLTKELYAKYNIGVIPLIVTLGDKSYFDGVDLFPEGIYSHVEETGTLPKTAARSAEAYKEFFKKYLDEGYDAIIYTGISSELSSSVQSACLAAVELNNVYCLDTRSLSTGIALITLYCCELAAEGIDAKEIVARATARIERVQASFIVDNMDFLHKGGRCSSIALLAGRVLKIKPTLILKDGKITVGKKYVGNIVGSAQKYAHDIMDMYSTPDKSHVFITYTDKTDEEVRNTVIIAVRERCPAATIHVTTAGATITSHCGKGTIGILYINDSFDCSYD